MGDSEWKVLYLAQLLLAKNELTRFDGRSASLSSRRSISSKERLSASLKAPRSFSHFSITIITFAYSRSPSMEPTKWIEDHKGRKRLEGTGLLQRFFLDS